MASDDKEKTNIWCKDIQFAVYLNINGYTENILDCIEIVSCIVASS